MEGNCDQIQASTSPESEGPAPFSVEMRTAVVGIGASAGGLDALKAFFGSVRVGATSYVVVQHTSPRHRSLLGEILNRYSSLPTVLVVDGMRLEPGKLYVRPADAQVRLVGSRFKLTPILSPTERFPVDEFFVSMAESCGARCAGVVLSGSGSDGKRGIEAIHAAGGIVVVQDHSAEFDGMPNSAVATGLADLILPPARMADQIEQLINQRALPCADRNRHSESFAGVLRAAISIGIDLEPYRRAPLVRPLRSLAAELGVDGVDAAREALERRGLGKDQLRRRLLGIEPQPVAWTEPLRDLLKERYRGASKTASIRAWVIGNASACEAFETGMLLDHALRGDAVDFRVFASDLDGEALSAASRGVFSDEAAELLPPAWRSAYLARDQQRFRVVDGLRRKIVFAAHDLLVDPPFTRLDLIVCRNVVARLRRVQRERVMSHLAFGLNDGGLAVFGDKEQIPTSAAGSLMKVDGLPQIFVRRPDPAPRMIRLPEPPVAPSMPDAPGRDRELLARIGGVLLRERGSVALVVDQNRQLLNTFGDSSGVLVVPEGEPTRALGQLLADPYRLPVGRLLRALGSSEVLDREFRSMVEVKLSDDRRRAVHATVIAETSRNPVMYVLVFSAMDQAVDATPVLASAESAGVESLELALENARADLRATVDELEAANRKLVASNTALTSSNEALQSTNEELHSVNEELHSVNAEFQRKIVEQEQVSADLDHLLQCTDVGAIFLDMEYRVRRFTPAIQALIPVLNRDLGRPVDDLRHGIVDFGFAELADSVLANGQPEEVPAMTADGRFLRLRAVPYRDADGESGGVVISVVDVTDIENARRSLGESEERFRQIAENIPHVLWNRTADGQSVLYLGPAFDAVWGVSRVDAIRNPDVWIQCVHDEDLPKVHALYRGLDGDSFEVDYRIVGADGQVRWIRDRGFPIRDSAGLVSRYAGIAEDITRTVELEDALRSAAAEMERLAHLDPLTGLLNRRGLEQVLESETSRAARAGTRLFGLLVDCDDFKSINDTFGHTAGDAVLREVSRRMRTALRPADYVARIGGDEFLLVLPGARRAEAQRVGERIRSMVADRPCRSGDVDVPATVSMGIAEIPEGCDDLEGVIGALQLALKTSKAAGKNRVATTDQVVVPGECIQELLSHPETLVVFAQSIRRLDDQQVSGFELLTRGPDGPLREPTELFQAATAASALFELDRLCLVNCMQRARALGLQGEIHVNAYPLTLEGLADHQVAEIFAPWAGAKICVELSEQQVIGDPASLRSHVSALQQRGVRVALDDVGFGRSSLEALIVLEPDSIKVDRAFVHECHLDRRKRAWLRRLVGIAQALGATVVAEGIESARELEVLAEVGIEMGQGFLWDRPHDLADRG